MTAFADLMARLGALEERVSTEITGLKIEEISGVADPANGLPFLIMKSKELGMSPDAITKANARLDEVEKALRRAMPKSPTLDVDPDDGAPLGPYGLPVRGDAHTDPALTGNVAVDLTSPLAIPALAQRYGPNLERLHPAEAQNLSMRPSTHPVVRQVLRRRAQHGKR